MLDTGWQEDEVVLAHDAIFLPTISIRRACQLLADFVAEVG
jgi:hypothetical protein